MKQKDSNLDKSELAQNETVRHIVESGQEARVAAIVEPEIVSLGYRLVRVRLTGQNGLTLQIMAEREDGTMNVKGCEEISRALSPLLDIEDPIQGAYHLEVSSPGIDRPLVRLDDFKIWAGHIAKLETNQMVEGRKRFKGIITGTEGDVVNFRRTDVGENEQADFSISIMEMANARLVLTDELISEALKRDKALRQANGLEEDDPDNEMN